MARRYSYTARNPASVILLYVGHGMTRVVERASGRDVECNQIEFVNLIISHLTEHGAMEPAALNESPFTDITPPSGPEGLFDDGKIEELIAALAAVRDLAAAQVR